MKPDNDICLCFHVPLRKIKAFLEREDPPVASYISECLGAGTGCGWCVPYLEDLHAKHQAGKAIELGIDPELYATNRTSFRKTGEREEDAGA